MIRKRTLINLFVLFIYIAPCFGQEDQIFFSNTFGKERPYRVFLPLEYHITEKKYPVVYYLHGNKGDHKLEAECVNRLVNMYSFIVVASNGYSDDSDIRPYNVGNHSNMNYPMQFKDYFIELIRFIDTTYRTQSERSGRAIAGHSMGGFMAFFLAGKYPDLFNAAVNMKGSPEFFIGTSHKHTFYPVRYLFKNMNEVKNLFTNSTNGELVFLNNEVHSGALREMGLNYLYRQYEGGHDLADGELEHALKFIIESFKEHGSKPDRWHHADLYPDFDVWGYEVQSNLSIPGYIEMRGVTLGGMGITTRQWQPYGRTIPDIEMNVKTAPVYQPNTVYRLLDYMNNTGKTTVTDVHSDNKGRIQFQVDGESRQIGIFRNGDPAEIVYLGHKVNDQGTFLEHNRESCVKLHLLNRGGSTGKNLFLRLSTTTEGVDILTPEIIIKEISSSKDTWIPSDFKIIASNMPTTDGSPFMVRFNLTISGDDGLSCKDEFDVPVFYNVPEFTNIGIDDGDTEIFGSGNGNNIADPGEYISIYEISNGSKRTRLYYDDPYIDDERIIYEMQPDKWGDGYTLSSVIHISDDCPVGHQIKFLACYEVKEWKNIKRNVTWGIITITVGSNSSDN